MQIFVLNKRLGISHRRHKNYVSVPLFESSLPNASGNFPMPNFQCPKLGTMIHTGKVLLGSPEMPIVNNPHSRYKTVRV